jgi:hypothetical protein
MATMNDADTSDRPAMAFNSIMPVFDDLLNLIGAQATSNEIGGGSNEEIVKKVRLGDLVVGAKTELISG